MLRRPIAPRLLACTLALTLAAAPLSAAEAPPSSAALELYRNLPRDPLLVLGVWIDGSSSGLARLASAIEATAARAAAESPDGGGAALAPERMAAIERALLPHLGPELALSLDVAPLDEIVAQLHLSPHGVTNLLLARVGVLARVKDAGTVDRELRRIVVEAGGEVNDGQGLVECSLGSGAAAPEGTAPPRLRLWYGLKDDRVALGFSPEWVVGALASRAKGERLADGEDFKAVFARLDARPSDLVYVNLPKLRAMATSSQILQLVLQGNPEFQGLFQRFFTSETMAVGLGSTTVRVDGGVRTTNFGPPWLSGAAISSGFLAALALPSVLATADRGRSRQTAHDIRAIAGACEGFSTDSSSYPGPTTGWVPVEEIARYLEPVYIGRLPRTDGWQNPILYWSNGRSYRIVSTGGDGHVDRDWTLARDPLGPTAIGSDIVFGDGRMLSEPQAGGRK